MDVLWYDGAFVPHGDHGQPRVPIVDPGYLLGDGVFATMRGYRGVCFRAAVHLADLARGAELFGIELPPHPLAALANEAAARTGAGDANVRITLTRGSRLSILARPMDVPAPDDYVRGASATIITRRAACIEPRVKTTSYAPALLARREAAPREAIQLGASGELACGAMANLFVVVRDALLTPHLASGCRDGVTRRAVLELAPRVGLAPREERLEPSILAEADEAFLTSTRIECLPLARVGDTTLRRGDRAGALRDLLRAEALR
ncbi:MAG TPA: aminotransferase class IV [Labilithrix sp.]